MQYGLIGAGPVSQYFAAKLPRVRQQLGPVAASSHRLASRIVNSLRAGEAIRDLSGLAPSEMILICAPDGHLQSLLPILRRGSQKWANKHIVLCDCDAESRSLDFLQERGASVASLSSLPGTSRKYLVEGDKNAVKCARGLVKEMKGAPIEIRTDHYALFRAAKTISSSLFTPLLEGCTSALRRSGINGAGPSQIAEALFLHSLRAYRYSGRKSWSGSIARGDQRVIEEEVESLRAFKPVLAELYCTGSQSAQKLFTHSKRHRVEKAGGPENSG